MISTQVSTQLANRTPAVVAKTEEIEVSKKVVRKLHFMTWVCLVLACYGASWFAYQYYLVPQPKYYLPDWHGAQWIRAADGNGASAYFHYMSVLNALPDNAFVTIAADQIFSLYVNGRLIASSIRDFGNYPRAYVYNITPFLDLGTNVLAIEVDNLDRQIPMLRATLDVVTSGRALYYGTGPGWVSTTQAFQVYPQNTQISKILSAWTNKNFNTTSWPPSSQVAQPPVSPSLVVNPLLYEQPISEQWVSGGTGWDGYFVQQFSVPQEFNAGWLRIVSTGIANIFINGNTVSTWDSSPKTVRQVVTNGTNQKKSKVMQQLMLGIIDVSPYLHPGLNTIGIHITSDNVKGILDAPAIANAELSMDMLINDNQGHATWLSFPTGWQVSALALPGWEMGGKAIQSWVSPVQVGPPGGYGVAYTGESNASVITQKTYQELSVLQVLQAVLPVITIVLGLWLLVSLVFMGRYFRSRRDALETMCLAYLPALALEGLLIVLSKEPQVSQPFPFTRFWAFILIGTVGAGYFLLWLHAHMSLRRRVRLPVFTRDKHSFITDLLGAKASIFLRLLGWLRNHWAIIPVVLIAIPLIFYNLGYEAYWQDELVSFDVAKSILHNGLPLLPSGFVYPKGELFSYMLAFSMKIFGDQPGGARMLSAIEGILTIILFYRVGCYFFDRRVALLGAVMLALSPQELVWARQVRMYQQAQLLTLLTIYLFYRAVQERHRVYLVYLAMGSLVATYLSHEETFIILPALVVCVLLAGFVTKDKKRFLPSFFYQKHWYFATLIAIGVIGLQLSIVQLTHPPVLGTDRSSRPMIQLTTDNVSYYYSMFVSFAASYQAATNQLIIYTSILLNTLLAILGCIWAARGKSLKAKYIALFFVMSFLTLTFLFTMQSNRYFYPIATLYYLLGAYALVRILRAFWAFARSHVVRRSAREMTAPVERGILSLPVRILLSLASAMVCLSVLIMPMLPLDNYNLFVSRTFGFPYYRHYADYDEMAQYVRSNLHEGDIVISIIPDSIVLYYIGQSDYFFSSDHALFLFENKGHIVDTYTGQIALLRQSDLDAVLALHRRIWLISSNNSYQRGVLRHFIIPPDFHVVYAEPNSVVYLRGG